MKFRTQRHRKQQAAEDQRQAEGALPVDSRMGFAAGFRDIAGAKRQHQQADRDIDKERVAPAQAGDIRRDQPAAAHLPDDKSNPTNPAIQTDRARMGAAFQRHMQGGEDLRHNQRRARALQRAGRQQPADGVGHAAQQRGEAKKRDPPHKQTAAAVVIAQLAAHRQAHRKRDAVEGDDQLQLGGAGIQ